MSVLCPGCGRAYDDTRFAHGRTLDCACGRRVGPPMRPIAPHAAGSSGEVPCFAADAMLGRLARWLRLLGFDATWTRDVADAALVRHALDESRWILTRDRALPAEWRVPRVHVVTAVAPAAQLQEVVEAFSLAPLAAPFARCTVCNTRTEAAPRAAVAGRVPPRVLASQTRFRHCPGCRRVYWEGTHVARMRRSLAAVLGAHPAPAPDAEPR